MRDIHAPERPPDSNLRERSVRAPAQADKNGDKKLSFEEMSTILEASAVNDATTPDDALRALAAVMRKSRAELDQAKHVMDMISLAQT